MVSMAANEKNVVTRRLLTSVTNYSDPTTI